MQRRHSDVGDAAPAHLVGGRGDADEDGFEGGRRHMRAATRIEVEETLGSGNAKGTSAKQDVESKE
jgi:hypothetical protein